MIRSKRQYGSQIFILTLNIDRKVTVNYLPKEWMKICPIQITICNDQSLKVFKKLNWSNNNNFVRRLKFYNYLNIVPAFRNLMNLVSLK